MACVCLHVLAMCSRSRPCFTMSGANCSCPQGIVTPNSAPFHGTHNYFVCNIYHITQYDAGLDGTGQIVGMGDTGIDWYHCTFTDSSVAGPGSGPYTMDAMNYLYWANPAHRKIVYYRQVADNIDENGHGTHCAGSAVGSLQSPGRCPPAIDCAVFQC